MGPGVISFDRQPCIDKSRIMTLAGLGFIQRAENIVFIGPTGVGKTGLALSLLRKALLQGYRGKFYKVQDLMDQLFDSLADRSSPRFLKRLANYDLLLLDELGYLTLGKEQMNMFFRLMDERYSKNKPTMITTNLEYDEWYGILEPAQMVAALLDRLKHHCVTISMIEGDTLRRPEPAATSAKNRSHPPDKAEGTLPSAFLCPPLLSTDSAHLKGLFFLA
ncbi:MAG: ATP-binding protein [Desulfovermiculus sp.]|nr:ATP-binding protein [Desulfovermiculus sp.]